LAEKISGDGAKLRYRPENGYNRRGGCLLLTLVFGQKTPIF
jgi:hypothetical protein